MSSQERRRSYSVGSFFNRNKSTYGLILPEEFQQSQANPKMRPRKTLSCPNDEEMDSRDCFVPSELDNWELPQYQSLLHHLTTQEVGHGSRRPSSASADINNLRKNENNKSGPIKAIQRWFRDFVNSLTHESDEDNSFCEEDDDMFPPSSAVEGIPVDICEKLRYVHIYY